ncbi:hypothetical protein CSC94_18545 [Zhengella mangrovi]|uniref:Prepilin type IV endopeptidase peptidase domain-containing protein n=1 Tax=Zhengella mangrovi TaxID=1982044 RepID=A0A2G1QJ90_9HYPH|nr:prepilin peptidase [Zhengella mangrovi]PHP65593.1 hypothetical protein CSC94_18545 [Zhengella mangrovi]
MAGNASTSWPGPAAWLSAAAGFAISLLVLPLLPALAHGLMLPVALAVARSDFRRYRIDHAALAWMVGLGFGFAAAVALTGDGSATARSVAMHLALAAGRGALLFALFWAVNRVYRAWRGITGIAPGDLVLFAAAGVWLPLDAFPVFLLVASIGALTATILRNRRRGRALLARTYVPFGGFLSVSLWLTVLAAY